MTTIELQPLAVPVPLRQETTGAIRVGKSHVLLELLIRAFQTGATPEAIVQSYETLALADVYAVISYYLATPAPIEEYLRQREDAAETTRRKIEAAQGARGNLREILLTRAKAMEQQRAQAGQ
jgi:uncharacterized protein (DUF433 family)